MVGHHTQTNLYTNPTVALSQTKISLSSSMHFLQSRLVLTSHLLFIILICQQVQTLARLALSDSWTAHEVKEPCSIATMVNGGGYVGALGLVELLKWPADSWDCHTQVSIDWNRGHITLISCLTFWKKVTRDGDQNANSHIYNSLLNGQLCFSPACKI